jgi:hypothetical protein
MPTSEKAFHRLLYNTQLRLLSTEGTHLATRLVEDGEIQLCYMPGGYFVEAFLHRGAGLITRFHTFTAASGLDAYAELVELPPEW